MEDTVLSKADENMAGKGNSVTISGWLSSMTTDHRNGPARAGKI